jgi:hypothetical protein
MFTQGHEKYAGRKKGVTNKRSNQIKAAYCELIEGNIENLTIWLSDVAASDPAKALGFMMDLSEYIVPKLARKDVDVKSGGKRIMPNIIVPDNETREALQQVIDSIGEIDDDDNE